jgi:hypothetical protein
VADPGGVAFCRHTKAALNYEDKLAAKKLQRLRFANGRVSIATEWNLILEHP